MSHDSLVRQSSFFSYYPLHVTHEITADVQIICSFVLISGLVFYLFSTKFRMEPVPRECSIQVMTVSTGGVRGRYLEVCRRRIKDRAQRGKAQRTEDTG